MVERAESKLPQVLCSGSRGPRPLDFSLAVAEFVHEGELVVTSWPSLRDKIQNEVQLPELRGKNA
jgi:hypothetical protein